MKCKSWYSKTRNSVTDCLKKKRYSGVTDERLIDCNSAHRTFMFMTL